MRGAAARVENGKMSNRDVQIMHDFILFFLGGGGGELGILFWDLTRRGGFMIENLFQVLLS
jgi:hypothetical protein